MYLIGSQYNIRIFRIMNNLFYNALRVIAIYFFNEAEAKIFSKILKVIKYVGFTPVNPKPPEDSVEPVSKGLSEA